jgi:nitroreductase
MKFLNNLCGWPDNEKPIMILPVGHPSEDANIPKAAKLKKPLDEISSIF